MEYVFQILELKKERNPYCFCIWVILAHETRRQMLNAHFFFYKPSERFRCVMSFNLTTSLWRRLCAKERRC